MNPPAGGPLDAAAWAQLSALFDTARDQPPAEQQRLLARVSRNTPHLAPWLRDLLDAHARRQTADWLERGPRLDAPWPADTDRPPSQDGRSAGPAALAPGQRIGAWVLDSLLGSGGMASVWRAHRADGLPAREVALKIPLLGAGPVPALAHSHLAQRFARERDILARLAHPHIARLYDAGVADDGTPWLAMECVAGEPIDRWCDARRLGLHPRVALFAQVLDAVQYAHAQLVIHRDLKPSNILVTADGQVRLLDFGIATLLAADDTGADAPGIAASALTQAAGTLMTPAYAAPEQLRREPLGTATDVYALGVVLHELLCGARPYRTALDTPAQLELAISQGHLQRASSQVSMAAASARGSSPQQLARALRGDLDTVLAKALHTRPGSRYPTAQALADDLARWQAGLPVQARPIAWVERLAKLARRHRGATAAGALAVAALLSGTAIATWQAQRAATARDRAVAANAGSHALNAFLTDLLNDAARTGAPVRMDQLMARAETMARSSFANQPDQLARVLLAAAQQDNEWTGHDQGRRRIQQALALARDPDLRADIACEDAWQRSQLNEADAGRRALLQLSQDTALDPARRGCALSHLGTLAYQSGQALDAVQWQQRAVDAHRASALTLPHELALQLGRLAAYQAASGQPGQASAVDGLYQEAFDLIERSGRSRSQAAITLRNERGLALLAMGDPRRAAPLLQGNLQIADQDFADTPLWLYLLRSAVAAHLAAGQDEQALALLQRGLDHAGRARLGPPALLKAMACDQALAHTRQGRLADATAALNRLAHLPWEGGGQRFYAIGCQLTQAELAVAAGQASAAWPVLNGLLQDQTHLAPGFAVRALQARALARLENRTSQVAQPVALAAGPTPAGAQVEARHDALEQALDDAQQALRLCQQAQGGLPHSARTGRAWMVLALVQQALGDPAAAAASRGQAVMHLQASVDAAHPWLLALQAAAPQPDHAAPAGAAASAASAPFQTGQALRISDARPRGGG